jgi:hypothetical protein
MARRVTLGRAGISLPADEDGGAATPAAAVGDARRLDEHQKRVVVVRLRGECNRKSRRGNI